MKVETLFLIGRNKAQSSLRLADHWMGGTLQIMFGEGKIMTWQPWLELWVIHWVKERLLLLHETFSSVAIWWLFFCFLLINRRYSTLIASCFKQSSNGALSVDIDYWLIHQCICSKYNANSVDSAAYPPLLQVVI